jgi:hypothetical protein
MPSKMHKSGGEFVLHDYNYFIKPWNGSILLLNSATVWHGIVGNKGFCQMGIALATKQKVLSKLHEGIKGAISIHKSKTRENRYEYEAEANNAIRYSTR